MDSHSSLVTQFLHPIQVCICIISPIELKRLQLLDMQFEILWFSLSEEHLQTELWVDWIFSIMETKVFRLRPCNRQYRIRVQSNARQIFIFHSWQQQKSSKPLHGYRLDTHKHIEKAQQINGTFEKRAF